MIGPKKTNFAKDLHRAMSTNGVNHHDLAWLMGRRWSHWLMSPIWNPKTGWFAQQVLLMDGTVHEFKGSPKEPTDPVEQEILLNLVRNAHTDPDFWKRKYLNAKIYLGIYARGLRNIKQDHKLEQDKRWKLERRTLAFQILRVKLIYWSYKHRIRRWFERNHQKDALKELIRLSEEAGMYEDDFFEK